MRFDLISIFPQFFDSLQLSLMGKAQRTGNLEIFTHDLRAWATGRHLAVDDSPAGGGAGMVMRADVWGRALDDVLEETGPSARRILAIPTPSGSVLTQRDLEQLAKADQIVVACGRYEGIDARVTDSYRRAESGVEVFEYSLGDYVLNGGEVAAVALVEGVSRLLAGVIGNPESLAEESHSEAGLLEYPVFTQPPTWRDLGIPEVLRSGDHAGIARWRRDQALERTARRRPDMIWALSARPRDGRGRPRGLDTRDLEVLAGCGYLLAPQFRMVAMRRVFPWDQGDAASSVASSGVSPDPSLGLSPDPSLGVGSAADAARLTEEYLYRAVAEVAAETFPMACPPGTPAQEIDSFVSENLTPEALRIAVESKGARICIATVRDATPPWQTPSRGAGPDAVSDAASDAASGAGLDEGPGLGVGPGPGPGAGMIAAYTLVFPRAPRDVAAAVGEGPDATLVYLSKCYAREYFHGSGVAGALMEYALADAAHAWGADVAVLGTNRGNKRAARFYRNHGFRKSGTRRFRVGDTVHHDFVFVRDLT